VVDYKTGSPTPYVRRRETGPFNGGRQLQPALYVAAISAITGKKVSHFEYRFPTPRGANEVVAYTRDELAPVGGIVESLLEHVRTGEFIPSDAAADCSFCDYQEVCRSSRGRYGTHAPRAEWAAEHAAQLPQYATMLTRRAPEGQ
jgi:hypothetical protein